MTLSDQFWVAGIALLASALPTPGMQGAGLALSSCMAFTISAYLRRKDGK